MIVSAHLKLNFFQIQYQFLCDIAAEGEEEEDAEEGEEEEEEEEEGSASEDDYKPEEEEKVAPKRKVPAGRPAQGRRAQPPRKGSNAVAVSLFLPLLTYSLLNKEDILSCNNPRTILKVKY